MATIDISREAFDPRKRYSSVRMQQGRVIVDDDWNANERIENEDRRRARVAIIGPSGSPDQGFRINNPPRVTNNLIDFDILPGSFYLGGLRLEIDQQESYRTQKDWLQQPHAIDPGPDAERYDLVYLEAWQQPVGAVEDSELFEVALGGPDTSMRIRNMYRIRLEPDVKSNDCALAWQKLVKGWTANKKGTLNQEHERIPDVTLTVSYSSSGVQNDLCTPSVAGGYLGAENQAIRVQFVDNDHFTWGFDNASPLYRVEVNTTGETVTLLTDPKDQAHWPLAGQIVEILPWSAVLPNGEKLAEIQKHLSGVKSSYDPDEGTLTLTTPLSKDFGKEWTSRADKTELQKPSEYFFMRVWNRGADRTSEPEIAFTPGAPVSLGNTGLQVTISGDDRIPGDYWIIAARPETPNTVVPWELEEGIAPHGVRRFYAPLAVIQWKSSEGGIEGKVVHDCRRIFHPLTDLQGCCTVTVGDGVHSQGDFNDIQEAINHLPATGGQVCILPGVYTENVLIEVKENITIRGCGEHSKIISETPSGESGTANPVIHVKHSQKIRIESLSVSADNTGVGILLEGSPREITLADLHISATTRSAIEVHDSQFITIRECRIHMSDVSGGPGIFFVGNDALIENNVIKVQPGQEVGGTAGGIALASAGLGGLQLGGTSERVRVINNLIQGGIGNGITLGTGDADGGVPGNSLDRVTIRQNVIKEAGLNGIGVQRYFAPAGGKQPLITTDNLAIEENLIVNCANQAPTIDGPLLKVKGYGGIALADGEHITIRDNEIRDNGATNDNAPVTGIFLYHGVGIEISGNRIEGNGKDIPIGLPDMKADQRKGYRGGIVIPYSTALFDFSLNPFQPLEALALTVRDNIVISQSGPALSAACNGKALIANNTFYSEGMNSPGPYLITSAGATVSVIHYGSNIFGWLVMMLLLLESIRLLMGSEETGTAAKSQKQPLIPVAEPYFRIADHFNSDGIIFEGNRCNLELGNTQMLELISFSIFLFSYSDIIYHGNQNSIRTFVVDEYLLNMLLFSLTHVVSGNSFREGYSLTEFLRFFPEFRKQPPPKISYMTIGAQSVVTSNNSTNCYVCMALPNRRKVANNVMTSEVCEQYENLTFELEG